jgi:16S rRNA (cytidine1402-2'-O)-methyltransferase
MSYHEHNKRSMGVRILAQLQEGKTIALVSDAGMPGISDPGFDIIRECIDLGYDFEVLPGPTALINALLMSGFSTQSFVFIGFLDRTSKKRKSKLVEYSNTGDTIILYEAPHRLSDTLKDIQEVFPNRKAAIVREITKRFEQTLRGTTEELLKLSLENQIKGEIVILIDGQKEEKYLDESIIRENLVTLIHDGYSKKDAVRVVSDNFKQKKNDVYKILLNLEEDN